MYLAIKKYLLVSVLLLSWSLGSMLSVFSTPFHHSFRLRMAIKINVEYWVFFIYFILVLSSKLAKNKHQLNEPRHYC